MAYRDDREALLARNAALEGELSRERAGREQASAEARKLRRQLGVLTRALGRGTIAWAEPTAARFLPLLVASLVGAATLIGVNVGRVRPPVPAPPASLAALAAQAKELPVAKPLPPARASDATTRLVPAGMGLVTFDSSPPARISVDGSLLGETPVEAVLLAAGTHVVQVQVPGRASALRRIHVLEGRSIRVDAHP